MGAEEGLPPPAALRASTSPKSRRSAPLRARSFDDHCGTSVHPGVYLQSDALIFGQLASNGVPEQLAFHRHPFCDVHEYSLEPALHDADKPLHELDEELQEQPLCDEHEYESYSA
jgi:hypothetical protein